MTLSDIVSEYGGIVATHELLSHGWTESGLRWAVQSKTLTRIRKGWYCAPELDPVVQQAARVGGRITCETLAEKAGLWVPHRDGHLHVAVLPDRTQLRRHDRHDVRLSDVGDPVLTVHWTGQKRGSRTRVDLVSMIVDLASCRPPWFVFVVAESALYKKIARPHQIRSAAAAVPLAHGRLLRLAGSASESGGESLFGLLLRECGLPFTQQVWIGNDRVDFLVGERLVVEIDGRAFHDRARDNRRDARLVAAHLHVLHFDSDMILNERHLVLRALLAAIARNEHRF
jgi:very-short-patch-repair endonuclease